MEDIQKQILVPLKELKLICGTTENNEALPQILCGFIYKNTSELADSLNTREKVNHGFIAVGISLIKKDGYICECGGLFFDKVMALEHYEVYKTETRNVVTSIVEKNVNHEHEVNEINKREKEIHEKSLLQRKISRNYLIMECIFMEYGLNHHDHYIYLCSKHLSNCSKKILMRILNRARYRERKSLENPYLRYIDDDIKEEAKKLHEKVSEEEMISSDKIAGFCSRHRILFEAIVLMFGINVMSYEFVCALALHWCTARKKIHKFARAAKIRERLGKENYYKKIIDSKIRSEAVRIYEEVKRKLRNDKHHEVNNHNHDQNKRKVFKRCYKARMKRLIMEAVFESERLNASDKKVLKYSRLLKLNGHTILKWRSEIVDRRIDHEVNPYARFITAEIRKRAAVLIQDVNVGAIASAAANGLDKNNYSEIRNVLKSANWMLVMEAIYHMYGTNRNVYYKRAAAKYLLVSMRRFNAHWKRVVTRIVNKEGNPFTQGYTNRVLREAMDLHRHVNQTIGNIKINNVFAYTQGYYYQRAKKIMSWLTHRYGLIDHYWYRESCGAFLNINACDIQSFCIDASKDFGSFGTMVIGRRYLHEAMTLHNNVMECMANAYRKVDSSYLSRWDLKLRSNCA